jgi:hypothetical protein
MANQVLGRGKFYFDPFTDETTKVLTGARALGNVPEASMSVETTTLDHFSSEQATRVKDQSVQLEVNRTLSFTIDSMTDDNLAMFFGGTVSSLSQASATGSTSVFPVLTGDRYYQLGVTSGNPGGVRNVSSVVISGGTLGTDFTVDLVNGLLYIVDGGALDGDTNVTVTYNVAASTRSRITSSTATTKVGRLTFVSDNTAGANHTWMFPYVKITASGEMTLIGEDWANIGFNVEVLRTSDTVEAVYCDGTPVTA